MNWGAIGVLAFIASTILIPAATVTVYDEVSETAPFFGISSSYKTKIPTKVNKTIGSESFTETFTLPTGKVSLTVKPGYYRVELVATNETAIYESDLKSEKTIRYLKMVNMTCKITETPESLVEELWTSDGYIKVTKYLGEISEFSQGNAKKLEDELEPAIELTKSEITRILDLTSQIGSHPTSWW